MSEQASEVVNLGQAIYDALSDEARAAVDALPDDVLEGATGQSLAGLMTRSADHINSQNAALWSLQRTVGNQGEEYLVLNVAGSNAVLVGQREVRVLASGDISDHLHLSDIHASVAADQTYKESGHVQCALHRAEFTQSDLDAIGPFHQQALDDLLGLNYKINHRWKWHRDDWRVKLAMVTGTGLSAPSYVPEGRLGMPMAASGLPIPQHPVSKRYWKISAGRGSADWPMFREKSIMAISWYDEAIDPSSFPSERDAFTQRLMAETSVSRAGAESIWTFRNVVSVGDAVLVYTRGSVLGHGIVTGDYWYDAGASTYRHRRAVDWTNVENVSTDGVSPELQKKLSRQQTLFELAPAEFAEAIGPADDEAHDDEKGVPPLDLGMALAGSTAAAGLTYTAAQIAAFYTALQTKGFVILSGISGTGKSKIAQRFAEILPDWCAVTSAVSVGADGPDDPIVGHSRIGVRSYMSKYHRFHIPVDITAALPLPDPGVAFNVPLTVDGVAGEARIRVRTSSGAYLFPKGKARTQFAALTRSSTAFSLRFHINATGNLIDSVEIMPFEPSSTVAMPENIERHPNHLFLPVRPDWRDGKALIGYHNPLTGEYVRTDFLDFVIAAGDDYRAGNRNAFFVILDEMNLAHVEYYFADVLSVIESGRYPDGHEMAGWTVEGIPLDVREEDADLPERLHLPPNLYIVGTVNMDETTHPFSPKVLDRAFTIELTDVDFSDYPPAPVDGDVGLGEEEGQALLQAFTQDGRYPRIDKGDIRAVVERHGQFRTDLDNLNTSLKRYRMHFGYRVFDEIVQFVHNAELNGLFTPEEAFDHAVLMKVLPKFNGSRARLERPLVELIVWSRQKIQATEDEARAVVDELENYLHAGKAFDSLVADSDDWRYPVTGRRAALMMQDLYTDGFASFG